MSSGSEAMRLDAARAVRLASPWVIEIREAKPRSIREELIGKS